MSSLAMSALIKLLGPMQAKILAAGAAGGAAVGTWQWRQARQALQSSGKSFDEIFERRIKIRMARSTVSRAAERPRLKSDRKTSHVET